MNRPRICLVVTIAAALAAPARAHDITCEKTIGLVELDAAGAPRLDAGGRVLFSSEPARVLRVDTFPAVVGFRVTLENRAAATSVVQSFSDELADALPAPVGIFGEAFAPGFALAEGARAERTVVVRLERYADCYRLAGVPAPAPACGVAAENRAVVRHESGSGECRARLVCDTGGPFGSLGIRQIGTLVPDEANDVAVAPSGLVYVLGRTSGFLAPSRPNPFAHGFLLALYPSGAEAGVVHFGDVRGEPADALAIAPDGTLLLTGHLSAYEGFPNVEAVVERWQPDPLAPIWSTVLSVPGGNVFPTGIAVDLAGNVFTSGYTADSDAFLARMTAAGAVQWTWHGAVHTYAKLSFAEAVAADASGDAWVVGGASFEVGGVPQRDAFVARYGRGGPNGSTGWGLWLRAEGDSFATDVSLDAGGSAYVVGYVRGAFSSSSTSPPGAR